MPANARGIDVSNWQERFNWAGAAGLSFGICRATQSLGESGTNSPDPQLAWHWPQIKARGLHRGAYHFLNPARDGAAQARYFVSVLARHGLEDSDMLWLDHEKPGATPQASAKCARAFMSQLVRLRPHNPRGVYTGPAFAQAGHCAGLGRYPLWLASYTSAWPDPPKPWKGKSAFWQWGIRGTDQDLFNGPAAGLGAWVASFAPPVPKQPPPLPSAKEDDMPSGKLTSPRGAPETISWAIGSVAEVALLSGWQGQQPTAPVVRLRLHHHGKDGDSWFDAGEITLDGSAVHKIVHPGGCDGCTLTREDAGPATVAYHTR
jgi:hypothetical protein